MVCGCGTIYHKHDREGAIVMNRVQGVTIGSLAFVLVILFPLGIVVGSCAGMSPLQKAVLTADINKDVVVMSQKAAAVARYNYLTAIEAGVEPKQPYLDDENWVKFQELETSVVAAQDVYVDLLLLAEKYEHVDDAKFGYYIELAKENWDALEELVGDLQRFLSSVGIDPADIESLIGGES